MIRLSSIKKMFEWIKIMKYSLLIVIASMLVLVVIVDGSIPAGGPLNVCGPEIFDETSSSLSSSLVFVSTLDGNLFALDLNKNGEKKWSVEFNNKPMLSSSIQKRELNNDGHWVRLIPSLSGGLYKFDGENLEALPVTPQQLLRSSFRYSDDLVLSGSGETHTYGVSSSTGQILYHCHEGSCKNMTENESYLANDVLVVRRFQDTIRAAEPRTGQERWNYSVGQHELELIPNVNQKCNNKLIKWVKSIQLKVNIPEGLIWAINKTDPNIKLWQYKFDSPIISIWREHVWDEDDNQAIENNRKLKSLNIFESTEWTWAPPPDLTGSPSIYVGMHDRQLYIQENIKYINNIEPGGHNTGGGGGSGGYLVDSGKRKSKIYPWRPYPASETALIIREEDDAALTTALSVLYNSEFINGNGFYLHSKEKLEEATTGQQCNNRTHKILLLNEGSEYSNEKEYIERGEGEGGEEEEEEEEEEETPVQVIIVSLWYWWKEVIIISITTAILFNFMLTQRLLNATTVVKDAIMPPLIVERHISSESGEENKKRKSTCVLVDNNDIVNGKFVSRYLTDFDPIDCLGKGGYGVVFEARKKIDHVNYAVKRITLPNHEDARERVMREVRALANLDHQNIVRYFHAWFECPPAGWKEEHDDIYINKCKFSPSEFPSEVSSIITQEKLPSPPSSSRPPNDDSVCIDLPIGNESSVDSAFEALKLNNYKDYNNPDESSCVVFDYNKSDDENSIVTEEIYNFVSDNALELSYFNNSSNDNSQSIIFKNSSSDCGDDDDDDDDEILENEKQKKCKIHERKVSLSLNFNHSNKNCSIRKPPKMFLYIQMQLCHRESLREWLKRQTVHRNNDNIENIFQQIVDGVEYVHLHGLIHRDLKPSNIFFSYDKKIKIGDFGLATAMNESWDEPRTPNQSTNNDDEIAAASGVKSGFHTAHVGTHLYMAPEQMNGQLYNYKVDIYALGIILFELLTPFTTDMERMMALVNLRKSIFPNDFAEQHSEAYDLLQMMLDENPIKRPTTLGIKARPPLSKTNSIIANATSDNFKWHFELPQLSRHSSVTNTTNSSSSTTESWDISNSQSHD